MYAYKMYGHYFVSDLELPLSNCLNPSTAYSNNVIPIRIQFNKKIKNNGKTYKDDHVNIKRAVLYRDKTAKFIITNGSLIEIYPYTNNKKQLAYSLLNAPIGYCLYQKGYFVLHASSVSNNDSAIIFLGLSGSGKSTLSTFFCDEFNFEFLTEDISKIQFYNDEVYAYPSHEFVKLDNFSASKFNLTFKNSVANDRLNRSHFKTNNFKKNKSKVNACYFLTWGNHFSIRKLTGISLLSAIHSSVLSAHPMDSCKNSSKNFVSDLNKFIKKIDIYYVTRTKKNAFLENKKIKQHYYETI